MQFFTIFLMFVLSGAELDLFIPSFPELQHDFHLSPFQVELTLGVNLIAHCLTCLMVGNIGNKFGNKKIILSGLFVFILGSLACIFSTSFCHILIGRALQGIGISGPVVLCYVVIATQYSIVKQQSIMAFLGGAITITVACAPVLGSYVTLHFKWQGNFVILLFVSCICLIMGFLYLHSPVPSRTNIIQESSFKKYQRLFNSSKTLLYINTIALMNLSYFLFIGMSPILFRQGYKVPLSQFGYYQAAIAGTFAIACFISSPLLKYWGVRKFLTICLIILGIFIATCLLFLIFDINTPLLITLLILILSIGILPVNFLWPFALNSLAEVKGQITAAYMAWRLSLTTIILQFTSFFYKGTFFPIGISLCIIISCALISSYYLIKKESFLSKIP